MRRLQGKAAIVTGAGSGIGRALVQRFIAEGAGVVAVVRPDDNGAALACDGAVVVQGDVARYETAEQSVRAALQSFGQLDAYIANAGVWDFHKRLERMSPAQLERGFTEIFSVNVLGALHGAHAARAALQRARGSLVVTCSNASFLGGGGGALYTASKFALRGAVMQLASEFAPDVRVNGVAPGATDTPIAGPSAFAQADRAMNADAARLALAATRIPLGRIAQPSDHTSLYVLLASREESCNVTGAVFVSDGGLTATV